MQIRKHAAKLLTVLWIILTRTFCITAQAPEFTLKADASLVSLDVSVSDSKGNAVTNLKRDDFLISEDGRPQTIRYFEPVEAPYNVLLLFDCSDSTQVARQSLENALVRFVKNLRPQDRFAIAAFGGQIRMVLDWNGQKQPMDDAATKAVCGKGTDVYGALTWAIESLKDRTGRKGIIALTDGFHSSTRREGTTEFDISTGQRMTRLVDSSVDSDFQKMLRILRQNATAVYLVGVNTDLNPNAPIPKSVLPDYLQVRSRMEQIAKASGGRVAYPLKAADVIPMYEKIGQELGTAYSIGYTPATSADDGKNHKIEVRVNNRSLKVRQSRDSYVSAKKAN